MNSWRVCHLLFNRFLNPRVKLAFDSIKVRQCLFIDCRRIDGLIAEMPSRIAPRRTPFRGSQAVNCRWKRRLHWR